MAYVPTFATRYLRDCVERDMDPRRSLDMWVVQQGRECDGERESSDRAGAGMGCISSARHALPSMPRALNPTNSTAPTSRKDTEPFITQTSTIFRELIGGHATGEIEEEAEQGDRKVHGFVYTPQGKRRTVFRGESPEHMSKLVPKPKPDESLTVSLPETRSPSRMVRTYKLPRIRRREKPASTTQEQEATCKLCTTYAQLRSCEAMSAAVPDIPVKCGPCLRKEMRGKRTAVEKSSAESGAVLTSKIMPRPEPTSRLRIVMKKGPPEAPAGNDQMALQMLADVQRTPKRVRRVPGRLLEI